MCGGMTSTAGAKCNKSFQHTLHIFDAGARAAADVRYNRYGIVIGACLKLAKRFGDRIIPRDAQSLCQIAPPMMLMLIARMAMLKMNASTPCTSVRRRMWRVMTHTSEVCDVMPTTKA
jgi:hypothetical protein